MKNRATKPRRKASARAAALRPSAAVPATSAALTLPAQFDIRVVQEVCTLMRARLAAGHGMQLDASAVTAADTAALQLLVVARRSAHARGTRFEWVGVSPIVKAISAQLGLSALLGLSEANGPQKEAA